MTRFWRDLALGVRLATSGGREGRLRLLLTAVGVGLGVVLLIAATAMPAAVDSRRLRMEAAELGQSAEPPARSAHTLLVQRWQTEFRERSVFGLVVEPEGPAAPVPPGLTALPRPGEMFVSPALRRLLDSPEGALLRPRLPYQVVGVIGEDGLSGPSEHRLYIGGSGLAAADDAERITHFGNPGHEPPFRPIQLLLILIIFVVLLLPIAVFIVAAVRFGGEQRDRRLAALRLAGADARMTQRIAAGEVLAATGLGLLLGLLLFFGARPWIDHVSAYGFDAFGSDLRPSPLLLAALLVAVPATAVGVALLAMRRVVVEPLGVVRRAAARRRRLWWRLVAPAAGLALVYPLAGQAAGATGEIDELRVAAGAAALLIGVTALLPWLVEAVVRRLGRGPVAWQLAVRRLQADSGTSARVVNGMAVAVAGAIALQMLYSAAQVQDAVRTGQDPRRAQALVSGFAATPEVVPSLAVVRGVRAAAAVTTTMARPAGEPATGGGPDQPMVVYQVGVGDCASLAELAELDRCADGDVFRTTGAPDAAVPPPGTRLAFGIQPEETVHWTVPADAPEVPARIDPTGNHTRGVLLTPAAAAAAGLPPVLRYDMTTVYLQLDPAEPDAIEHVRNTVLASWPHGRVQQLRETAETERFTVIRRALSAGALVVLGLIGVSMVVAMLEQLHERRRLLAVLAAFGTRRATLAWSVLWQTAIPVLLGLVLAVLTGVGLGVLLLRMTGTTVHLDWSSVGGMAAAGAGLILLVTALTMPALWRLMRADGLRTE